MDEFEAWCADLARSAGPTERLVLPPDGESRALLAVLGVPEADADEVVATWPTPRCDPERWWLLERAHQRLVAGLGPEPAGGERWPDLPASFGPMGPRFYVHLFLAATPALQDWHARHGVDAAVSHATLADVGRQVDHHRARHGCWGIDDPQWLVHHFRGRLFQLGRVQFQRGRNTWTDAECAGSGAPFGPGEPVLGVHIPPDGPLPPASVAAAFARARRFFARCFPADACAHGVGESWMFDPTLATYLAPGTNIVRFAELFHLVPGWERPGRDVIVATAFGRPDHPVDPTAPGTALQRAVATHLAGGGRWAVRRGWCEIPP